MIAFVFPGQGAQYVGMGVELAARYSSARRVFDEASESIGVDLLELCRLGPEERLCQTENTQPAILTSSWAVASALGEHGIRPAMAAGLSLGEYTALVSAGALALADAAALVRQRGKFMQDAVEGQNTAMVAVLGLPAERVEEICRQTPGVVEAANFNAPGQVVVGGEVKAVEEASARLLAGGARRITRLAVSAPFHTSLMRPAAVRLSAALGKVSVAPARIPVVANVTAQSVREPQEIRAALLDQVSGPVRWEQSVRTLRALGASVFVEVGPGTTLAGLIRRTVPDAVALSVQDQASLAAAIPALGPIAAPPEPGRAGSWR